MSATRTCHYRFDAAAAHGQAERSTLRVVVLTAVMMVVEIVGGAIFGSMALLADGWHMATHVAALAITSYAYYYARKHADNPSYTFGTGKIGVLAGFASGIALLVVATFMAIESIARLFNPGTIRFAEAIAIAFVGLGVNLLSAWWLHDHDHDDADDAHHQHGHDFNLRAAYLHVLADAMTSVLAIVALFAGKGFGWVWLDAVVGILGAVVIGRWCYGLLGDTSGILLDKVDDTNVQQSIRNIVEGRDGDLVEDLHLWQIAPGHLAAIVSLYSPTGKRAADVKERLQGIPGLVHLTVQVRHDGDGTETVGDASR